MIILFGAAAGLFFLTGICSIFYERTFWREQGKKDMMGWIDRPGLLLYEKTQCLMRKFERGREAERRIREQYRAVFLGQDEDVCRRREQARIWGYLWLSGIGISIIGIAFCLQTPDPDLVDGNRLTRPSFGEGEAEYEIFVSGLGEETERVTVTVGEQKPPEEEMRKIFDETFREATETMLAGNPSMDEVRSDLTFSRMSDEGIRLEWESGNEEWLNSYGEIVRTDIPQEGVIVPITLVMNGADREAVYSFSVRILPPVKDLSYYREALSEMLQRTAESNPQEAYVELPDQLQEYHLEYAMPEDKGGAYLAVLGVLALAALAGMSGRGIEVQYEKRSEQMMEDYSQIISQLSILILCGMNVRNAWKRVVGDYEKRKAKGATPPRYAYEEMRMTSRELERGAQEGKAYEEFGRRCGIYCYVKLGNLMEQGVRQGAFGMGDALRKEAADALEHRIHEAKRKSEQAETKTLLPMFVMFGIVMAVLMIPAFLTF